MKEIKGKTIIGGCIEGEALVSRTPFGFFGGVDPSTGTVIDKWHELYGESIKGKIFVYPEGRGSTVGAAIMLELARTGCIPKAILNIKCETITVAGGLLAKEFYGVEMPIVDSIRKEDFEGIKTGAKVKVNADNGQVVIY